MDSYKYIIPFFDFKTNRYKNYSEDENLHYVAITRAKKFVWIICGTKRTNDNGVVKNAEISEFITSDPYLKKLSIGNIN